MLQTQNVILDYLGPEARGIYPICYVETFKEGKAAWDDCERRRLLVEIKLLSEEIARWKR